MDHNRYNESRPYPKGALEIEMQARRQERELASLRAEYKSLADEQKKRPSNLVVRLITALLGA